MYGDTVRPPEVDVNPHISPCAPSWRAEFPGRRTEAQKIVILHDALYTIEDDASLPTCIDIHLSTFSKRLGIRMN